MKIIILSAFSFMFILLSCKELTPIDDSIEIKQAIPSPAKVGDTLKHKHSAECSKY